VISWSVRKINENFQPSFLLAKERVNERSDVRVSKICAMRLRKCCSQSRLTPAPIAIGALRFPTLSSLRGKRVAAINFNLSNTLSFQTHRYPVNAFTIFKSGTVAIKDMEADLT